MAGGFFRGTNVDQDQRFGDATKKMIEQSTFSSLLKKPVDMKKVNLDAIKPWLSDKINGLLGIEDEVLFEYVVNLLEESDNPDPRAIQVNLTGFLEDKSQEFMQSLWAVLLEAQHGEGGIPESFIRRKMEELQKKREEEERAAASIRASNSRMREQSAPRRERPERRSRWDVDAADGSLPKGRSERASSSYSRSHRDSRDSRDYDRRRRNRRRSRSRSRSYSRSPIRRRVSRSPSRDY